MNSKKVNEIAILNKAIEIRAIDFKQDEGFSVQALRDMAACRHEVDNLREENANLKREVEEAYFQMEEKNKELNEHEHTKNQLSEIIVEFQEKCEKETQNVEILTGEKENLEFENRGLRETIEQLKEMKTKVERNDEEELNKLKKAINGLEKKRIVLRKELEQAKLIVNDRENRIEVLESKVKQLEEMLEEKGQIEESLENEVEKLRREKEVVV